MARVTVEDCLERVENRFQLVVLAARRARQLERGGEPTIEVPNRASKSPVIALREIGSGGISPDEINRLEIEHELS